jgi:hypothetical protein
MIRAFLPLVVAGLLLLLAAVLWFVFFVPADRGLVSENELAWGRAARVVEQQDDIVGDAFHRQLARDRERAEARLMAVEADLSGQVDEMRRWFPFRETVPLSAVPPRDLFPGAYRFGEDRLREDILRLARAVPEAGFLTNARELPLIEPAFARHDGDPSPDEMREAQRQFNLQRMLLTAAAREGAIPAAAPAIRSGWQTDPNEEPHYVAESVTLEMLVPPGRVPGLLRSLLALDGRGPPVKLTGLALAPGELPLPLPADVVPPLRLHLTLDVFLFRKATG